MYFARACILAIYADHPAARKCSLTGSACPVCYTPQKLMAKTEQEPVHELKRTPKNMKNRKRVLRLMANGPARGAKARALLKAQRLGIKLDVPNAFEDTDSDDDAMVFGPCPKKDNVFQALPQVRILPL
jgi:hypothetical protein